MKIIFIYFIIYVLNLNPQRSNAMGYFEQLGNIVQPVACIKSNGSFSYRWDSSIGPDCWPVTFPQCAGKFQSPIDIDTERAECSYTEKPIVCSKWTEKPDLIEVENTGKTIHFNFEYKDGKKPILHAYPITTDTYQFDSAHLHFIGSEHSFNHYQKYSMEAHMIFFNLKYVTVENAFNHKDGLIVIGKFYQLQHGVDPDFTFVRRLEQVGAKIRITDRRVFSLQDVFGPINFNFYTYSGSLTIPGCNEVVTWVLDDKPLKISVRTIKILRKIRGNEGLMSPNIRPIQPSNSRKVYYYRRC